MDNLPKSLTESPHMVLENSLLDIDHWQPQPSDQIDQRSGQMDQENEKRSAIPCYPTMISYPMMRFQLIDHKERSYLAYKRKSGTI